MIRFDERFHVMYEVNCGDCMNDPVKRSACVSCGRRGTFHKFVTDPCLSCAGSGCAACERGRVPRRIVWNAEAAGVSITDTTFAFPTRTLTLTRAMVDAHRHPCSDWGWGRWLRIDEDVCVSIVKLRPDSEGGVEWCDDEAEPQHPEAYSVDEAWLAARWCPLDCGQRVVSWAGAVGEGSEGC